MIVVPEKIIFFFFYIRVKYRQSKIYLCKNLLQVKDRGKDMKTAYKGLKWKGMLFIYILLYSYKWWFGILNIFIK